MESYNYRTSYIISLLGTAFVWLFGEWDLPLMTLVTAMILDYITGITRGYINKQLSSEYGYNGIYKKVSILYILALSVLIDRLLGQGWIFRSIVCFWYIANEGISILENIASIGLPIPEKLEDALIQLKQGNKKYNMERDED